MNRSHNTSGPDPDIDWDALPQAAGLCSLDQACSPGLSVDESVRSLKYFHYAFQRIWRIMTSRLASEPVYEVKMVFSHHAYLCSENVKLLRDRVAEMRQPPLGLDKVPHEDLKSFFDEIQNAPETHQVISGLYETALPLLEEAMARHGDETNPLADAPTHRLLRFAGLDVKDMLHAGDQLVEAYKCRILKDTDRLEWSDTLAGYLDRAGGMDGSLPVHEELKKIEITPVFSDRPFEYNSIPRRDHRFPDPYNMGVHAEEYLYNPQFSARSKTLMMYFKRLREIDVPEMMASILIETPDKDWNFYRDMTRQLWDEARHAIMGEVGFYKLGINWPEFVRINSTWSRCLNEQLTPRERHAVLWFIEQGLMSKTGKRYEWEIGSESGDELAALFQDYDWADEVLHARIGRDWYVRDFESVEKAAEYGSQCWSRVVADWDKWVRDGLTRHENWWPELYREFCRLHDLPGNPEELSFNKSYRDTRADLQRISTSG